MFKLLISAISFISLTNCHANGSGHPVASDSTGTPPICPTCHELLEVSPGVDKCVYVNGCCPEKANKVNCFVQPCMNFNRTCPRAAHCYDNYCDGCNAIYYDANYDVVAPADCNTVILSTPKTVIRGQRNEASTTGHPVVNDGEERTAINVTNILGGSSTISKNKAQTDQHRVTTTYFELNGSEKPGRCPSIENSMFPKYCTSTCTADKACPGKQKCCYNGCAHHCRASLPGLSKNFLNYPITIN